MKPRVVLLITALLSVAIAGSAVVAGEPPAPQHSSRHDEVTAASPRLGVTGGDITFCELFSLGQFGRLGNIVGLSVATTSWNIGDTFMSWRPNPDPRHPFIAMNLYREKGGRLEQIGQSWVKHGFFALTDSDCGTGCVLPPVFGRQLGVQCTDTYGSSLNAMRSFLGPRKEINPWTGAFTFPGSHLNVTDVNDHDAIEHRLQVHDDDLDPALNPGAVYYSEAYYVHFEDVDHLNSLAWKPVTVSGTPGATWTFGMSPNTVPPTIGPALDAWTGTQTVVAQELPIENGISLDGRCILAVETTDLGGGNWHYEYALYNHDMDRAVRSFTVPVASGAGVSNLYFHAVASHDEGFSNTPWTVSIGPTSVTWATDPYVVNPGANPLRWGTLYNFAFDADTAPVASTMQFGLFTPGNPTMITAVATAAGVSDCNTNGIDDVQDIASGTSGDCNSNGLPDECEPDCNTNGLADECDIDGATSEDCDGNGVPDECDLAIADCNSNGVNDACDAAGSTSNDCDGDSTPDECQLVGNDCDGNQVPDQCDPDCNTNGTPDVCDITGGTAVDCNSNIVPDACDLAGGTSQDCNGDNTPDDCQLVGNNCNSNAVPDDCETDCNNNNTPDDCDIAAGTATDCNTNSVPDSCDLITGTSNDCDTNSVPDECQIAAGTSTDCNHNGVPDDCDIAGGTSTDTLPVGGNGIPDECEADCNTNGVPDFDEIFFGTAGDCNSNGVPDLCEGTADCNTNGVLDLCELFNGTDSDCNHNGVLDSCETVVKGDGDGDGDRDLRDFGVFQECYNEPATVCGCMDMDDSGTVDAPDVPLFVAVMGGP